MEGEKYNTRPGCMFSGDLWFLSNMYPCPVYVLVNGKEYAFSNSEAAYHAGKCEMEEDILALVQAADGYAAKKLGRKVKMCAGWEEKRIGWMAYVVQEKFAQNPDLMEKLIGTYPLKLEETNYWRDTFWGICDGVGENHLGKILMEIRDAGVKGQKADQPEKQAAQAFEEIFRGVSLSDFATSLANQLLSEGFIVHRYDAFSTNSIYLKLDFGVYNSIRISDHEGKAYLKYRYNIGTHIKRQEAKQDKWVRYYYPLSERDAMFKKILADRAEKQKKYGTSRYEGFMVQNKKDHENSKGFWAQSRRLL